MIKRASACGLGVGGIEAEARPCRPNGCRCSSEGDRLRLSGAAQRGRNRDGPSLPSRRCCGCKGVVGKFVEFYTGMACRPLPAGRSRTIGKPWPPEYGATTSAFPGRCRRRRYLEYRAGGGPPHLPLPYSFIHLHTRHPPPPPSLLFSFDTPSFALIIFVFFFLGFFCCPVFLWFFFLSFFFFLFLFPFLFFFFVVFCFFLWVFVWFFFFFFFSFFFLLCGFVCFFLCFCFSWWFGVVFQRSWSRPI